MNKIPYIVSAVTLALTGLFAILNRFWVGFVYFVLSLLMALSLFWAGWLLYKYFTDYRLELEEEFKIWKANRINTTEITSEIVEQNEMVYRKQFSKYIFKNKFLKWFEIALCFALALSFFLGIVFF